MGSRTVPHLGKSLQLAELIDRARDVAGSDSALARALGATPQKVNDWRHGRAACPPDVQAVMASLAGGDPVAALINAVAERLTPARKDAFLAAVREARS